MVFDNWTNSDWIKEKDLQLKQVDPSFSVSSISGNSGDKACAVGCFFKQKGNKDKIDRLIKMGWKLGRGHVRSGVRYIRMETYF